MIASKKIKLLIISLAMATLLSLMLISVDPEVQYSVDEVMENPNNYENKVLFIRGDVLNNSLLSNENSFVVTGLDYEILVDYSAASLPEGFQEELPVAINGKLVIIDNIWTIQASEIITGCPSKYETV
jgi:cytochrome c-type biogenesis protein CcmE